MNISRHLNCIGRKGRRCLSVKPPTMNDNISSFLTKGKEYGPILTAVVSVLGSVIYAISKITYLESQVRILRIELQEKLHVQDEKFHVQDEKFHVQDEKFHVQDEKLKSVYTETNEKIRTVHSVAVKEALENYLKYQHSYEYQSMHGKINQDETDNLVKAKKVNVDE
jgi:hypothetical protein